MYSKSATPFPEAPNLVAPRLLFDIMAWNPGPLKNAKSPLLVVAPTSDDIIPYRVTEKVAEDSEGSEFDHS